MAIAAVPNLTIPGGMGVLTLGAIAAFLTLSRNFMQPINQMAQQINFIAMAMAGAERIFALMDEPSEQDEGYVELVNARRDENGELTETAEHTGLWAWKHPHGDGTLTYTPLAGEITMLDVDFSYDGKKTVLHDISLRADPGQKIAFVGSTGAGKTTVMNLINRFYDVGEGSVTIDGRDIREYSLPELRRNIAVVLQETHLFTGTIMENIRYGRLDATDEEVVEAAVTASADSFIRRLPKGYQTRIEGDGTNLSQGQRQLLNIARAAVSKAPVLVLDEATSSVDTRTEKFIEQGMDRLMKDRTTFVIAHRLSTVRNADAIMVLENGVIIERGTHAELLARKGRYYELYTGAAELD
jgi:ATP-binding cassette subfamily B protein